MGVGDLIGKYIVIAIGCLFYFFSITTLLDIRSNKADALTFFRSVDKNDDGLISKKEYTNFKPCEEYDDSRALKEFQSMGKKITPKDVQHRFTPKISNLTLFKTYPHPKSIFICGITVKSALVGCSAATPEFTSLKNLKNFNIDEDLETFFDTYDLNNDKEVRFSEYSLVNSLNKKSGEEERDCFKAMDLNHDWKLTRKELGKVKFSKIGGEKGRKKK